MKKSTMFGIGCLAVLLLGAAVCGAQTNYAPLPPEREEAALRLLENLWVLEDKRAGQDLVVFYALRRKIGSEHQGLVLTHFDVERSDLREALEEVNGMTFTFAQRKFPNLLGLEAMNRLNRSVAQRPGLQALYEMFRRYGTGPSAAQ